MATRTAQIVINVDQQQLVRLNNEIITLRNSIESLNRTSQQYADQARNLQQISSEYTKIYEEVRKVNDELDYNAKNFQGSGTAADVTNVGKTITGALGQDNDITGNLQETGKAFENLNEQAQQAADTIKGLSEVATAFTTKGGLGVTKLTRLYKGFIDLAKGLGPIISGALAPAAIALAVVGIIALIVKWNDLIKAVKQYRELRALKDEQEQLKLEADSMQKIIALEEKRIENQKEINNLNNEEFKNSTLDYELTKKKADAAIQEYQRLQNEVKILAIEQEKAQKKLEKAGTYSPIDRESSKAFKEATKNVEAIQRSIEENKAAQEQIVIEYKLQEEILNRINNQETLRLSLEGRDGILGELENQLKILEAQENQSDAIYVINQKILDQEIQKIEDSRKFNGFLTEQEEIKLKGLEAEKVALKIANDIRNKNLYIQIQELQNAQNFSEALDKINNGLLKTNRLLTEQDINFENRLIQQEKTISFYDKILKTIKDYQDEQEKSVNFDIKREEYLYRGLVGSERLFQSIFKMNITGKEFNELWIDFQKNNIGLIDSYNVFQKKLVETLNLTREAEKDIKKYNELGNKATDENLLKAAQELAFFRIRADEQTKYLNDQNETLNIKLDVLKNDEKLLELNKLILADQIARAEKIKLGAQYELDHAKSLEQQAAALEKVNNVQKEIAILTQDRLIVESNLTENYRDQNTLNLQIEENNIEILGLEKEREIKLKEISIELDKQSRLYKKLQDGLEKYNEEIIVSAQLLSQTFEMLAAFQDRQAEISQQRIDEYNKQLDLLMEKEQDRQDQLQDWEDELKDANGVRYDELLGLINDAEKAQTEANQNILNQEKLIAEEERKRREAEFKAARWRKAQAIIDTIIQTALAVVQALPNVFLSVAVGVLGAAAVTTIAAQKLPPKDFAKGGFTGVGKDNEPAGIVHKNEMVVPAKVVRSPYAQSHIEALEQMRLRGYQEGGFVTPANISQFASQFDYDKFVESLTDAIGNLPNPQVGLVNISSGLRDVELTKQNAGLTR